MKNKITFFIFLTIFGSISSFAYSPTPQEFMRDMRDAYNRWIAPNFRNDRFSRIQDAPPLATEGAAASGRGSASSFATTLRPAPSLTQEVKAIANAIAEYSKAHPSKEAEAASGRGMALGCPVPEETTFVTAAASGCGAAASSRLRKAEQEDAGLAAAMMAEEEEAAMMCGSGSACGAAAARTSTIPESLVEELKMQFDTLDPIINIIKTGLPESWSLSEALQELERRDGKDAMNVIILKGIPRTQIDILFHREGTTLNETQREVITQAVLATSIRDIYRELKALMEVAYPTTETEDLG